MPGEPGVLREAEGRVRGGVNFDPALSAPCWKGRGPMDQKVEMTTPTTSA